MSELVGLRFGLSWSHTGTSSAKGEGRRVTGCCTLMLGDPSACTPTAKFVEHGVLLKQASCVLCT